MNASDCLLHTSASEGSPNVVKEALACNLPVVATPAGDIRDLLSGVTDSYVCAPIVGELADALVRCLDPPRRSNGREFTDFLDEGLIAERVAAVYERVSGIELRR
jgi:glycosyltransferase involved in cell wall biosynthesis